jgi:hypothetical protein
MAADPESMGSDGERRAFQNESDEKKRPGGLTAVSPPVPAGGTGVTGGGRGAGARAGA